jgi:hypothetical protein
MITIPNSYESLLERYPTQVAACIEKLRKGTSKYKEDTPGSFTWEFFWGIRIPAISLGELLTVAPDPKEPSGPEVIAELRMTKGRFWAKVALPDVPEEITQEREASAKKILEDHVAEVARWSKMTPKEIEDEKTETLKKLLGEGGFVALQAILEEERNRKVRI